MKKHEMRSEMDQKFMRPHTDLSESVAKKKLGSMIVRRLFCYKLVLKHKKGQEQSIWNFFKIFYGKIRVESNFVYISV